MKIGAALLAAGRSQRFGDDDKLLAEIAGQPMIRRAIAAFEASSVAEIVVVTPIDGERLMATGGQGRWRYVANPDADAGMATSLRVGLSALGEDCSGALIALADMPYCSAALIDELCAAFAEANGDAIVFPESPDGRQGHPVLWPRRFFADLLNLEGDKGGKAILNDNRDAWHPVPISDESAFFDVDTATDLDAARKLRT